MANCPVCTTEYIEGTINFCITCGWDLTPYPPTFAGQIPEAFLDKERAKLAWARQIWAKSQSQLQQLDREKAQFQEHLAQVVAKLDQLGQAPSQEVSDALSQTQSRLWELQSQLSQVQGQLQQIQEGGTQLLEQARQERLQMQAQLQQIQEGGAQLLEQARQERSQIQSQSSELSSQGSKLEEEFLLTSAVGVDYRRLRGLLAAENWQGADRETRDVILWVCAREQEGEIEAADIDNFPCQDLRTIDQLWVKYSNERFGFSVQKRIWHSVNADILRFSERVGWPRPGRRRSINLNFSLSAPVGHLPFAWLEFKGRRWFLNRADVGKALCSRLDACQR